MAACYLGLNKFQEALQSCQRAKRDHEKNVKTLYRQAQAYVGLTNYVEAASSYWECVMLEPKNALFMKEFQKNVDLAKK